MTQLRDNGPFSIPIELEILYKIDLWFKRIEKKLLKIL